MAVSALAQPAPNARPQNGQVVGGAATISQTASTTRVTQTSANAAIDWRSFDVGSRHSVQFVQPSERAATLNRVVGPNPSQIAGRISANGQVIIENQAGVLFTKGAQINTAGLVVTTAGSSDTSVQRFVAGGKLVLDQPSRPNATVRNEGEITVRDAGLAALVAPQVANSGVITARLGHVVLAGARQATLDLYGDGMLALNVSDQVVKAPGGSTALVTNSGVIRADGGTVQLTARAVDGVITTLVDAGGSIKAGAADGKNGSILISGLGGSVVVRGDLNASAGISGSKGGTIQVASDGAVAVATRARIVASGRAGGGTIALGSISGGPTAQQVSVSHGAVIAANATARGDGGHVVVNSRISTAMHGRIIARGGPRGGGGGLVEVSGAGSIAADGPIDVAAPAGKAGTILFDPVNLTVTPFGSPTTFDTMSANYLDALTGSLVLSATNDLRISGSFSGQQDVTLLAGHLLSVDAGVTVTAARNALLLGGVGSATSTMLNPSASGGVLVNGSVRSGNDIGVLAGTWGVSINGSVLAPNLIQIASNGGVTMGGGSLIAGGGSRNSPAPAAVLDISVPHGDVTENPDGIIVANALQSTGGVAGSVSLNGARNVVPLIDGRPGRGLDVGGDFGLTTAGSLTVKGALQAGPGAIIPGATLPGENFILVSAETDGSGFVAAYSSFGSTTLASTGGQSTTSPISVGPSIAAPPTPAHLTSLTAAGGPLSIGTSDAAATIVAGTVSLSAPVGAIIESAGSTILANTLTGHSGSGTIVTGSGNQVANLGRFSAGAEFALTDGGPVAQVLGHQTLKIPTLQPQAVTGSTAPTVSPIVLTLPITQVVEAQDLTVVGPVTAGGKLSLVTSNGNITTDGAHGGALTGSIVSLLAGANSSGLSILPQTTASVDQRQTFSSVFEAPQETDITTAQVVAAALLVGKSLTTKESAASSQPVTQTSGDPNGASFVMIVNQTFTTTSSIVAPVTSVLMPAWRGDVREINGGTISANTLSVSAPVIGGANGFTPAVVDLTSSGNRIAQLASSLSTGAFSLTTAGGLTVLGPLIVGINNYDQTVLTTLTANRGNIAIGTPTQFGALFTDRAILSAPLGQLTLGATSLGSAVWCFCGAENGSVLPPVLANIPFIRQIPTLLAALETSPPTQASGLVNSNVDVPHGGVADAIPIFGPPTGANADSVFPATGYLFPQFFFTPGIGGLNVTPAIQLIATPAQTQAAIYPAAMVSTAYAPAIVAGSGFVQAVAAGTAGSATATPAGTASIAGSAVARTIVPVASVTVAPATVTPATVTPATLTATVANSPLAAVADPERIAQAANSNTAAPTELAFGAMCVTRAGICPQRSSSPINPGTACTCSNSGKIYQGVIQSTSKP